MAILSCALLCTWYNDLIPGMRRPEEGKRVMKFRTRLRVTFVTIIALPLVLTALAFCGIGLYLMNVQKGFPIEELD